MDTRNSIFFINTKKGRQRILDHKEITKRILNGEALSSIMKDYSLNYSQLKQIKLSIKEGEV